MLARNICVVYMHTLLSYAVIDQYLCAKDDGEDERSLILGRPVGIAVAGGSDGSMAARQVQHLYKLTK